MQISELALEKIKAFEGCRLSAYRDAAEVWTIGYGHTKKVKPGDKISQYWADEYLKEDIEAVEAQIEELGLTLLGLAESPIKGREMGNVEYLSYWRR
jgi:lysozyme